MKVISVVGARPQFIKAAIVSKKMQAAGINEKMIHTGQHYDFNMSEIFFQELGMAAPQYYLEIGSSSHGEQTGRMLWETEKVLLQEKPSLVIVYGDTNSTLAGALAAAKLHIPVAHVEAGLRSFNKKMPEELNRILTDHVSHYLFSPTETGLDNLQKEGFTNLIHAGEPLPPQPFPIPLAVNIGDVMFDIALAVKEKTNETETLGRLGLEKKNFLLATIHRAENTDNSQNLQAIWAALIEIATGGKTVYFPIHPRTRKILETAGFLSQNLPANLIVAEPVSYTDMIVLESCANVILTDSGGVQKEGYFFRTPVVIAREQTEWVELVQCGWNVLAGANKEKIIAEITHFWNQGGPNDKKLAALFGNGDAASKIVNILQNQRT